MRLIKLADTLFVYRLTSLAGLVTPQSATGTDSLFSLSVTGDEISLVSPQLDNLDIESVEGPWAGYRVEGVLDFGLTGILHSLTGPLAEAGISVFAVSTYDTDYLLVRTDKAEAAEESWSSSSVEVSA